MTELHLAAAKAMGWTAVEIRSFAKMEPWWVGQCPDWFDDEAGLEPLGFTIRDVGPIIERYGISLTYFSGGVLKGVRCGKVE